MIEFLQMHWVSLAFLAGLLIAFLLLRTRATRVDGLAELRAQGQPVVVELFSNA